MFDQGIWLMLVGMGSVFLFLTTLVGATTLMSSLVMRLQPRVESDAANAAEVAAITAAIAQHRQQRRD